MSSKKKPSSIINTAFADERAAPRKFRVKRAESKERKHAKRKEKEADATTGTVDDSGVTPSQREATRSLSPGKLRKSSGLGSSLPPVLTPVMKGLRRLSRSAARSHSPGKSRKSSATDGTVKGENVVVSKLPVDLPLSTKKGSNLGSTVSPAAAEDDVFAVFSGSKKQPRQSGMVVDDYDVKPLMPPSGRLMMDSDSSDEGESTGAPPPSRSRKSSAPRPGNPKLPSTMENEPKSTPSSSIVLSEDKKPISASSSSDAPPKPLHKRNLSEGINESNSSHHRRHRHHSQRGFSSAPTSSNPQRVTSSSSPADADPRHGTRRTSTEESTPSHGPQKPLSSSSNTSQGRKPSSSGSMASEAPTRPSHRRHLEVELEPGGDDAKPQSSSSAGSSSKKPSNSSMTSDAPPRPTPRRNLTEEPTPAVGPKPPSVSSSISSSKKPTSSTSSGSSDAQYRHGSSKRSPATDDPAASSKRSSTPRKHSSPSGISEAPPRPLPRKGGTEETSVTTSDSRIRRSRRNLDDQRPSHQTNVAPTTPVPESESSRVPRRARSSTPSRRSIEEDLTRATAVRGSAAKSPSRRSRSFRSTSRPHRSKSQELKRHQHSEGPAADSLTPESSKSRKPRRSKSQEPQTQGEGHSSKPAMDEPSQPKRTRSKSQDPETRADSPGTTSSALEGKASKSGRRTRSKPGELETRSDSSGTSPRQTATKPRRTRSKSREPESKPESAATLGTSNRSGSSQSGHSGRHRNEDTSVDSTSTPLPPSGHSAGETPGKQRVRRGKKPQHFQSLPQQDHDEDRRPSSTRSMISKNRIQMEKETEEKRISKPASLKQLLSNSEKQQSRRNLDKQALQNVKELKSEIMQMRSQRRKVNFDGKKSNVPTRSASDGGILGLTSPIPTLSPGTGRARHSIAVANVMQNQQGSSTTFHSSKGSLSKSPMLASKTDVGKSKSFVDFNASMGAISLDDLDVGFVKAPVSQGEQQGLAREQKAASLQKQIKKTKKLIKRATREVFAERDEIVTLQRKNWSIRKALMQSEAPPDSVTTLNMKIEKLVRQERELDLEADRRLEEKEALTAECAKITKNIGEFKELLDKLNLHIVPLLPPQSESDDVMSGIPLSPLQESIGSKHSIPHVHSEIISGAESSDTMADSIHSTEENEEPSLSLSHLRMAMSSA